jgi:NADPH-dependent 2,4-dienoyl-CoA reductase/sulfur reductase-like enzyme
MGSKGVENAERLLRAALRGRRIGGASATGTSRGRFPSFSMTSGRGPLIGKSPRRRYRPSIEVVIVGAGTFGASLAWWLARGGDEVTLVDQFEPGDPRASLGGETRLYRCAHGPDTDYTAMARRARTLWRELEEESGEELLVECGLAWFAQREDG